MKVYQIDAFTNKLFCGNPATVIPLDKWLDEVLMQQIAMENCTPETAFFIPTDNGFHIRWYSPLTEMDLCGHATLASAYVLFRHMHYIGDEVVFDSRSGELRVWREEDELCMDFPVDDITVTELTEEMLVPFTDTPVAALYGRTDLMLVFENEKQVADMKPNLSLLSTLDYRGIIVTAPGNDVDFVSRFFAPQTGINEDPATGSAHTTLVPYWSTILKKKEFISVQLSDRGGYFTCRLKDSRVEIVGKARTYMVGEIKVG
jgi:PhzF family phenazine biosynthesis protein